MSHRSFPFPVPHGPPRAYRSLPELVQHAVQHANERLYLACEAIAMVGGLAPRWRKARAPAFELIRAKIQDGRAGSGEQAAHTLPGQLLIDGRAPWELDCSPVLKAKLMARFAVTEAVPTPFNVADSAAEASGLKDAFTRACSDAWSRVGRGERDLTPVYAEFLADASRAFEKAELRKGHKQDAAATKGDRSASDERLVETVVLRAYKHHCVTAAEASRRFPVAQFTT